MKKSYKISLIILLIISLVSCEESYNYLVKYNLNGKVSKISSFKYHAIERFGEIKNGKRIARDSKNILDKDIANVQIIFNEYGFVDWITKFDERNSIETKLKFDTDSILSYYYTNGDLKMRSILNNSIFPTEIKNYDSTGQIISKEICEYDKNKLISKKSYNASGELLKVIEYSYNDEGFIEKELWKEIQKSFYSYKLDTIKSFITYEYNDNNDIIKYTTNRGEQKISKNFKYTYDEFNNWITRIEFEGLVPKYIIKRKIEYFE